MSTITSPRLSITSLATPNSSRRPSLDSQPQSGSYAPSPALSSSALPTQRRGNRAALREYYRLKNAEASNGGTHEESSTVRETELDAEGFDAEGYVRGVLARDGLEEVLRIEGCLVNEIKGLDGERKALVYDNYSKLIAATDTIRKMRSNMDPLTPSTSTLSPAISHIADTASSLAELSRHKSLRSEKEAEPRDDGADAATKRAQQETVKWVLGTPRRLQILLDGGKAEAAAESWMEARRLLDRWEGVAGVDKVRDECLRIMKTREDGDEN